MPTPRSTLSVSFVSTLVMGMLSGALGPLIPGLSARLAVPIDALGALFTALFLGALTLQCAGGWLNERLGLRTMVMAGTALLTLGVGCLALAPSLPALLVCAAMAGAGLGAVDASANVLVASVYDPRRAVSALNILHFAFGAGAVLSPMAAAYAARRWGTPMPALGVAVVIGILHEERERPQLRAGIETSAIGGARGVRVARHRGIEERSGAQGEVHFLYVGVEVGVGGWTTVYLGRVTRLDAESIAWVLSGYWLALTGGRLLGALFGLALGARALTALSLAGGVAGALLVLAGGAGAGTGLTVTGTLLCGLSFGPVFPTVLVIASDLFKEAPNRAITVVIAVSSLGGMALPPLQGVLLNRVSPLASIAFVAAACVLQLAKSWAAMITSVWSSRLLSH
jgi:fucose permease